MILSRYERMIARRYLLPGKGEGFIFLVAGISLFAVMLGVAALVIVMSVMNGFRAELFDKVVGLNGHAVIQVYGGRLEGWQPLLEQARRTPGVTSATPLIEQPLMASHNGRVEGVLLRGMRNQDFENNPLIRDNVRAGSLADRSQLYKDLADGPFFGHNREGAHVSQGIRDAFWLQSMQSGHRNALECIKAFSETDFRADLRAIDVPTLIIHGDDDQVVPFEVGGKASAGIVLAATLIVYEGAPHGITDTHKDKLNADMLAFVKS